MFTVSDGSKRASLPAGHEPLITATLRTRPEDFVVQELLDLPSDESTTAAHLWVCIEKRERNTQDVVNALAKVLDCPPRDIGFAGLKDRRAVTQQWFSLPAACTQYLGSDVAVQLQQRLPEDACARVLDVAWRSRKLRRGAHAGNRFEITLREVRSIHTPDALERRMAERIGELGHSGFPNAFGPQRFGAGGRNLTSARRLLARAIESPDARSGRSLPRPKGQRQRQERGLLLSAARSHLFNQVLEARVANGTWQQAQPGEPLILVGSNSRFVPEQIDDMIHQRLREGDLSTSGPMPGRGDDGAAEAWVAWEASVLQDEAGLVAGLTAAGVEAGRRALCAQARDLACRQLDQSTWCVTVTLDSGVFATSLLAQLGICQDATTAG